MALPGVDDSTLKMAKLSPTSSIWAKISVGGLIYLASINHQPTGEFSVGEWQKLPGGWEHLQTFYYSGNQEYSYVSALKICALDESRALLIFSMYGTQNYAMVVRFSGGTLVSGTPTSFEVPTRNYPPGAGSYSESDQIFQAGTGRAVVMHRELVEVSPGTYSSAPACDVFTASGMTVSVGSASVSYPAGIADATWDDGDRGDGWWGWWTRYLPTSPTGTYRAYTECAWFRLVNGAVVSGPAFLVKDQPYNPGNALAPRMHFSYAEHDLFVAAEFNVHVGAFSTQSASTITFRVLRLTGNEVSFAEGPYSGPYGPTSAQSLGWPLPFQAFTKRHLVDMWKGGSVTTDRVYRHFSLTAGGYTVPDVATYSDPPDDNANGGSLALMQKLASNRLMVLHDASTFIGHGVDVERAEFRLLTMVVPPVCPPRYVGEAPGDPTLRISQATAVVRGSSPPIITTDAPRDPCGEPESELSNRGPVRVYPVGRR